MKSEGLKILLGVSALVVALLVSYYFFVYIPKLDKICSEDSRSYVAKMDADNGGYDSEGYKTTLYTEIQKSVYKTSMRSCFLYYINHFNLISTSSSLEASSVLTYRIVNLYKNEVVASYMVVDTAPLSGGNKSFKMDEKAAFDLKYKQIFGGR